MKRSRMHVGGVAALLLLAIGGAFFLLRSGETVVVDEGPGTAPPDNGAVVVVSLRESGGFSLLGDSAEFRLGDPVSVELKGLDGVQQVTSVLWKEA